MGGKERRGGRLGVRPSDRRAWDIIPLGKTGKKKGGEQGEKPVRKISEPHRAAVKEKVRHHFLARTTWVPARTKGKAGVKSGFVLEGKKIDLLF